MKKKIILFAFFIFLALIFGSKAFVYYYKKYDVTSVPHLSLDEIAQLEWASEQKRNKEIEEAYKKYESELIEKGLIEETSPNENISIEKDNILCSDNENNHNDFIVQETPNGIKIIEYIGFDIDVVIPCEINQLNVVEIGASAFLEKNISSVFFPNTIKKIEENAFEGNALKELHLPKGITHIGDSAFFDNEIKSVTIPNNYVFIDVRAFANNKIKHVSIPEGVRVIKESVFSQNELTNIDLPSSITRIDNGAFYSNSLIHLKLPEKVFFIGDNAFSSNQLKSVSLPHSLRYLGRMSFQHNKIESLSIPVGIKEIPHSAFFDNKISELSISNSVEEIGDSAFEDNKLTSFSIPNSVKYVGYKAFGGNPKLSNINNCSNDSLITSFDSRTTITNVGC